MEYKNEQSMSASIWAKVVNFILKEKCQCN